jgi:nitrate reductase delta subunit
LTTAAPVSPFFRKANQAAVRRLKHLTSEHFRLSEDAIVMVTELACTIPGCPPVETVFAFWPEGGQRRQFKVFKPAAEVDEADLPPWWMKDALIVPDWIECECC